MTMMSAFRESTCQRRTQSPGRAPAPHLCFAGAPAIDYGAARALHRFLVPGLLSSWALLRL